MNIYHCYRWSLIAGRLPGRTDNEVKNYWNSHIRKKLIQKGIDPNKPHGFRCTTLGTGISINKSKDQAHNPVKLDEVDNQVFDSTGDPIHRNKSLCNLNLDLSLSPPSLTNAKEKQQNLESSHEN